MLGHFNPSKIEDELYSIMDDYETEGTDLFNYGVTDAIADYLLNHAKVEYQLCCSNWPDETGGTCGVSWVENGHPHLILFDYKYGGV